MLSDKTKDPEPVLVSNLKIGDRIKLHSPGLEEIVVVAGVQAEHPNVEDGTFSYSLVEITYAFRQETYVQCFPSENRVPTKRQDP